MADLSINVKVPGGTQLVTMEYARRKLVDINDLILLLTRMELTGDEWSVRAATCVKTSIIKTLEELR